MEAKRTGASKMRSKTTELDSSNLDVAALVKQAQQMRNQAIAEMIAAGWQGARRIATNMIKKTGSDSHSVAASASTHR